MTSRQLTMTVVPYCDSLYEGPAGRRGGHNNKMKRNEQPTFVFGVVPPSSSAIVIFLTPRNRRDEWMDGWERAGGCTAAPSH